MEFKKFMSNKSYCCDIKGMKRFKDVLLSENNHTIPSFSFNSVVEVCGFLYCMLQPFVYEAKILSIMQQ